MDDLMESQLLTLAEAGAELNRSAATLRSQIHNGKLRARLIGKTWVVTPREVARYRRRHRRDDADGSA